MRSQYMMRAMMVLLRVLVCSALLLANRGRVLADFNAPVYSINLDLPPEERWKEIITEKSAVVHDLIKSIFGLLPKVATDALANIGSEIEKKLPEPYAGEIKGVAAAANVSIGEAVMANMIYELSSFRLLDAYPEACTSIVAEDGDGTIYHARNQDYAFTADLRKATIVVNFQKNGVTQFTGTTFAGYIGLPTGQKPNKFTISLNARNKGEPWDNVIAALLSGSHGVLTWRVREVLEDQNSDFASALETLSSVTLITSSYIIIGGAEPTQGAVITRDRLAALDVWKLAPLSGQWYVLETNYDHWGPAPATDDRRDPGMKAMNSTGRAAISPDTLFTVLSTPPVLNEHTIYTNIMSAATPEMYRAVVRSYK